MYLDFLNYPTAWKPYKSEEERLKKNDDDDDDDDVRVSQISQIQIVYSIGS